MELSKDLEPSRTSMFKGRHWLSDLTPMAVSLLAANSPIGILFAAFLFGVLKLEPSMNAAQVPSELVSIVTASIIFFVRTLSNALSNRKKQVKEVSKDVYYNLAHPLGVFYAGTQHPSSLQVSVVFSLNVVVW